MRLERRRGKEGEGVGGGRGEGEGIGGGRGRRAGGGGRRGKEGESEGTGKEVQERCVWKAKDQGIRNPVARLIRMQLTIQKKNNPKNKTQTV